MRTIGQIIADLKEELRIPDTSLCGPALTDHDWTVHSRDKIIPVGCDAEKVKFLLTYVDAFAECSWCACIYDPNSDKVVENA